MKPLVKKDPQRHYQICTITLEVKHYLAMLDSNYKEQKEEIYLLNN
jgi:hypothetical protein